MSKNRKQQANSENNWQFRNKWPISLPKFHENRLSVDKRNLVIEKAFFFFHITYICKVQVSSINVVAADTQTAQDDKSVYEIMA